MTAERSALLLHSILVKLVLRLIVFHVAHTIPKLWIVITIPLPVCVMIEPHCATANSVDLLFIG